MNINNIAIPELLVAEMYRDNLLAPTPGMPVAGKLPAQQVADQTQSSVPPAAVTAPVSTTAVASSVVTAVSASDTPTVKPEPAHAFTGTIAAETSAPTGPAATAPSTPAYKFLGLNRRKITVVVYSPGMAYIPDDQLAFLTKMLEACKMNVGDVAIVNHAVNAVNITAIRQQLEPTSMLLFGIQPIDIKLPINFPAFKLQAYDDCTYLASPALSELVTPSEESKVLKGKLWACLKALFNI